MAAVSGWQVAITPFNSFSGYFVSGDSFFAISLSAHRLTQLISPQIKGMPVKLKVELGASATAEDVVRVVLKKISFPIYR